MLNKMLNKLFKNRQFFHHKRNKKKFFTKEKASDVLKQYTWYSFCDTTSIHGLRQIFQRPILMPFWRALWILLWLSLFVLTFYACFQSTMKYMKYNVKVDMSYQTVNELPFPAITFCNVNTVKRSAIGSHIEIVLVLKLFASLTKNLSASVEETLKEEKFCSSNITTKYSSLSSAASENYSAANQVYDTGLGFEDSVKQCWWNSMEHKCDTLFVNHVSDIGLCFTFNPDKVLVSQGRVKNGTKEEDFSEKIAKTIGPRSGIKLLLNTDQNEYCGNIWNYVGAGFKFVIHDSKLLHPSLTRLPSTALLTISPGTEMTIALKPVRFFRKTEHLACGCFPPWVEGNENFVEINLEQPLNSIHTKFCLQTNEILCTRTVLNEVLSAVQTKCPFCSRDPCDEKKYEQTVSTSYFPTNSLKNNFFSNQSSNITWLRKNYMLLNVFYEDMNILNVVVSQEFTFIDLIIYYGGIIGLFLGMSFLSVVEPVDFILQLLGRLLRQILNSKSNIRAINLKQAHSPHVRRRRKKIRIDHNNIIT